MARKKDGYKKYGPGDPIHIVVTQDFVETANDFFSYCRDHGYNPSQIIRQTMADWLKRQNREKDLEEETERSEDPLDIKLMRMVEQKRGTKNRISLKTAKEILEEE